MKRDTAFLVALIQATRAQISALDTLLTSIEDQLCPKQQQVVEPRLACPDCGHAIDQTTAYTAMGMTIANYSCLNCAYRGPGILKEK